MNPRTHFRLVVLYVLVAALLLVLVGRMWTLQVLEGEHYRDVAAQNRTRDIVVPAVRGMILDDRGRPSSATPARWWCPSTGRRCRGRATAARPS